MTPTSRSEVDAPGPLRVIGIDPGSERTGIGIVEHADRKSRALFFETVQAGREPTFPGRLLVIHRHIVQAVRLYAPQAASVEDVFHARNVQSALKLGQARGAILLTLQMEGVELFSYTPLEIKKAIVGYGRAEKEQVRAMVRTLLGLQGVDIPIDASDALAAALSHVHQSAVQKRLEQAGASLPPARARWEALVSEAARRRPGRKA